MAEEDFVDGDYEGEEPIEEGINEGQEQADMNPDNMIEFQGSLVRPDAAKQFKHIHKDFTTSYLYDNEITALRNMGDLVRICQRFGLKNSKDMFLHDSFMITATARSRKGFERKMLNTNIQSSKQFVETMERPADKKKKWGIF